jgi:site-specific recombinase XerD
MNNPFDRVSIKESKKGKIKRRPFVANEITKILNYQFGRPDEARGYKKEALLYLKVATYTGMRLNEIACIPLANIVQIDGVWVFDLHGIDVKNEPSERIVPIAQKLLDLGMLEFIADCRKKRNKYLFEEVRKHVCNPEVKGYGDPISRWFNRTVLKNIGINKAEEKANKKDVVFHCLRHTVITKLVNAGVEGYIIKQLVGHSQEDDVTIGIYASGREIPISILKKVMDDHLIW